MKYLAAFLLLFSACAFSGETTCSNIPPTQYGSDLYYSLCLDTLFTKCSNAGYDPLLTTCGDKMINICRGLLVDYENQRWDSYNACLSKISPSQEKN